MFALDLVHCKNANNKATIALALALALVFCDLAEQWNDFDVKRRLCNLQFISCTWNAGATAFVFSRWEAVCRTWCHSATQSVALRFPADRKHCLCSLGQLCCCSPVSLQSGLLCFNPAQGAPAQHAIVLRHPRGPRYWHRGPCLPPQGGGIRSASFGVKFTDGQDKWRRPRGPRTSNRFSPAVEKRAKGEVTGRADTWQRFLSSFLIPTFIEMVFFCHLCASKISVEAMWPFLIRWTFLNVTKGQEVIANVVWDQLRAENDGKCREFTRDWYYVRFGSSLGRTMVFVSNGLHEKNASITCRVTSWRGVVSASWSQNVKWKIALEMNFYQLKSLMQEWHKVQREAENWTRASKGSVKIKLSSSAKVKSQSQPHPDI